MVKFNSNFNSFFFHSSNPGRIYNSLSECLLDNQSISLSSQVSSIFTRYGNRPPYPYTTFDSIYELNDSLPFTLNGDNSVNLNKLAYKEVPFSIQSYLKALRIAISTERKHKVVFLSSGWDSTSILALLVEKYGPENITCITLRLAYNASNKDQTFNPYEIKKAISFCDYYKVKHILVDSDFCNFDIDQEERLKEMSVSSFYNFTAYNHKTLFNAVETLGFDPSDTAIYAGEFSDGAHNWGFAQSFGAVHPEIGLRQYADKARAYFMSPSYLNRVFEGDESLINDSLTNWLLPGSVKKVDSSTTETEFLADYLCDLYYEDVRGPYVKPVNKYIPRSVIDAGKYPFLNSIIYPNLPQSINQIYKSYIDIYHYTHWMGSTVHGLRVFCPKNYQLIMPFGDPSVLELLRSMPTEYGRGLEIRPTKYPLKKILKEYVDYPLSLQEGKHAYIYDDDQSINIQESVMSSGVPVYELLYSEFRSTPNESLSSLLPDLSNSVYEYTKDTSIFSSAPPTHITTAFLLLNYQLNNLCS